MKQTILEMWPNSIRESNGDAFLLVVTSSVGVNTVRIAAEDEDGFLLECLDAITLPNNEGHIDYKRWMNLAASARLGSSVVEVSGIEHGILFTKSHMVDVVGCLKGFMGMALAVVNEYRGG